MSTDFYIGKRLSYDGRLCTVRYHGEVQGTKGEWLGVEWDDPTRGKHAGEHQGVKYFECEYAILDLTLEQSRRDLCCCGSVVWMMRKLESHDLAPSMRHAMLKKSRLEEQSI